jgi:hypothetical protein
MSSEFHARPLIHIVDDDGSMRMVLIELLKTIGFDAIGYGSTGEFPGQPPVRGAESSGPRSPIILPTAVDSGCINLGHWTRHLDRGKAAP